MVNLHFGISFIGKMAAILDLTAILHLFLMYIKASQLFQAQAKSNKFSTSSYQISVEKADLP